MIHVTVIFVLGSSVFQEIVQDIGGLEIALISVQACLMAAVGIMGAKERRKVKGEKGGASSMV